MAKTTKTPKNLSKLIAARLGELKDLSQEMMHTTPAKRKTRLQIPITKGSKAQFGYLNGVPGGNWFAMAHAETTGCIVASLAQEAKLMYSAQNSYTTKSAVHHFGA